MEDDNKGLIDEHMEVGAIKEESSSEQGYHMPNDVLGRSFSSTTMPECRAGFNPADSARNKSLNVMFGFTVVGKRTYSASPGIRRGNRPQQGSSSSQYANAKPGLCQ